MGVLRPSGVRGLRKPCEQRPESEHVVETSSLLGGLWGREHSALVRPDTEHVFGQQSKLGESKLGSPSDRTAPCLTAWRKRRAAQLRPIHAELVSSFFFSAQGCPALSTTTC